MGDITYRHVFQDNTTDTRRVSMALPPPAEFTQESPFSAVGQEPAQQTLGQAFEVGSPRSAYYQAIAMADSAWQCLVNLDCHRARMSMCCCSLLCVLLYHHRFLQ